MLSDLLIVIPIATAIGALVGFGPWYIYNNGYRNGWRDCDADIAASLAPLHEQLKTALTDVTS